MFCDQCGHQLPDGVECCPNCGKMMTDLGAEDMEKEFVYEQTDRQTDTRTGNRYHSTSKGLGGLVLSENEELVRQYHCSSVLQPKCEGYLSVTTKRMIFQAEGGSFIKSRIAKEVSLDKVTGIDCYYGTNMKISQIIWGIVLLFLGIILGSIFRGHGGGFWAVLFWVIGIILIVLGFRKSFKVTVYASECSPSPITVGLGAITLQGNAAFYATVSAPTKDTDRMMNELGALVHDMRTMGDMAIAKWKE